MGNKTFDFSSKKKDFLLKNDQILPKICIFGQFGPGHAGLFGALLVGCLVVVAQAVSRKTPIYFIVYLPFSLIRKEPQTETEETSFQPITFNNLNHERASKVLVASIVIFNTSLHVSRGNIHIS